MNSQHVEPPPATALEVKKNDFDLVAPIYDVVATATYLGAIKRAQLALIPEFANAGSVLVIGGGTGWFLLELLARTPVPHVLYIEQSEKMMNRSMELVRQHNPDFMKRVEFRLGTDASLTEADGPFDVVVTNFFLDLFNDQNCLEVAQRLHTRLAPTGRWLFVDFHMPESGLPRLCATVLFKIMFTFFNVVSNMESRKPPNYQQVFDRLGLRVAIQRDFYLTMIRAKLLSRV